MINYIINNKQIEVHLQPIVTIKNKKVFAYEALTRAFHKDGSFISPQDLFEQAKKEGLSNELDNYVREVALQEFYNYYKEDNSVLLFVNVESSTIENEFHDNFIATVSKYDIPASNIVVEIKEEQVENTFVLKEFISRYKKHGFIIAIDDFGTGYSSFDRLEVIKPDIVKIDRSIIHNVHNNFINSEILSAITKMCNNIGALVLAEGVEDNNEVINCMKKDIDIFQGYYFSKPMQNLDDKTKNNIISSIQGIGDDYTNIVKEAIYKKQVLIQDSQSLSKKVAQVLQQYNVNNLDDIDNIFYENNKLEAVYIIGHDNGKQVGKTFIKLKTNSLYSPTSNGHDHTLRDYYFIAKNSSKGDYLSNRYISKASGNMCRTYSSKISLNGNCYIVCFDITD